MNQQQILGNRVRFFRKRAGLSQMQLELELEASPGSLSRIENGEVNPTKETVTKIADVLDLNVQERQYLYGPWFYLASDKEAEDAINDTKEYFSKKGVLAYILDERFRVIALSKSFQKLLGFSDKQIVSVKLKPFLKVIINDELGIRSMVPKEAFKEVIKNLIASFYADSGFMQDDSIIIEQINAIKSDPLTASIWEKVINSPKRKHNDKSTRKVIISVLGKKVDMYFSRDPLYGNRRFEVVEYTPSHPFLKFINKLIL